ncbi:MAG: hypothetical protein PHC91_01770 [Eubacteriales bacterium]|nr:hypothetical protein [Eubacteriales bacterium]
MYRKQEAITTPILREGLCFSYEQLNIVSTFQRLFTQLATSMRATIAAWVFKTPDYNSVSQNLTRVPVDFRNALLLFYGPAIADRFNNLMTSFISNIFTTLEGYGSNDQELLNQSTQKWYHDANELSKFLNSINVFWTEEQWANLFYQYIQLKSDMINAFYTGNYDHEEQIYNRVFDLMTIMGSFMAQGLIARDLLRTRTTLTPKE